MCCIFSHISIGLKYRTIRIQSGEEGIVYKCYMFNPSNSSLFFRNRSMWCLPSASLKLTLFVKRLLIYSPYLGGFEEFTSYDTNNTHLTSSSFRSCYCHEHTPVKRDDFYCFFTGTSFTGLQLVSLNSDTDGC